MGSVLSDDDAGPGDFAWWSLCFVGCVGAPGFMCLLVLVLVWIGAWWRLVEML